MKFAEWKCTVFVLCYSVECSMATYPRGQAAMGWTDS